jgi:hypothetical protein
MKKSLTIIFICSFLAILPGAFVAHAAILSKPPNNNGLVGWWTFDEGAGTVAHDFSGGSNTGSINGTALWVPGKRGRALNFDGVSNYVVANLIPAVTKTGTYTFSAWVKTNSTASQSIFDNPGSSGNCSDRNGMIYSRTVTGDLEFGYYDGVSWTGASGLMSTNAWHHVVGINNAGVVSLYIDGVLQSGTNAPYATCGSSLQIGQTFSQGMPFSGQIDDARFYSRALSASDVLALYRAGQVTRKTVSQNGLVGWWTLDEGTSTVAHDFSGNGNNGTLTNISAPPTSSSGWTTSGKRSNAITFDGTNDYVDIPDSTSLNPTTGQLSMTAWVKRSNAAGDTKVFFKVPAANNAGYGMAVTNQKLEFSISGISCDVRNASGGTTLSSGVWYFLAATYDGITCKTYVNAVVDKSVAGSGTFVATSANLRIGADQYTNPPSYPFAGIIDDVRLYNRALSVTEISKLYRESSTRIGHSQENVGPNSGLVGYWSFNGPDMDWTNNVAYDRSGQGNVASIVNGSPALSATPGRVGQAMVINPGYITENSPTGFSIGTSPRTISVWFKLPTLTFGGRSPPPIMDIFGYGDQSASGNKFQLAYENPNQTCGASSGLGVDVQNARQTFTWAGADLNWHHLAAVLPSGATNANQILVYLDGALMTSASCTSSNQVLSTTNTQMAIGLGANSGGSVLFTSTLDEGRVYNRALSASEVKQLYLLGR